MQDTISEVRLTQREFGLFRDLIYSEAGISMGDSKFQLVASRLAKRLRALNLSSYTRYYDYVMHEDRDGSERLRMINCLTTNKTDFFREDHHFEFLKKQVFPAIEERARKTGERKLRIWSAACSTGEEPYSIAMTVRQYFSSSAAGQWDIRILASDIDTDVLAHAQRGVYASDRIEEVPPELRRQWFSRVDRNSDEQYVVHDDLKSIITFRRINFVDSVWPVNTAFDVIFCRNVMIYFDESTQDRLLTRFHEKLKPEGYLIIGHSESILRLDHLYRSIGQTIYQSKITADKPSKALPAVESSDQAVPPVGSHTTVAQNDVRSHQAAPAKSASTRPAPSRTQPTASGDSMDSSEPHRNAGQKIPTHPIIVGEVKASRSPLKISTLLGSCVSVCLYDPVAKIGGMNHFMLPSSKTDLKACATYGIHAMELLINEIMKLGGDRRRLVAKVFGGGNVLSSQTTLSGPLIGDRNAEFALQFLKTDGIPIVAQDLGGTEGRHVHFLSHSGQAFVKPIQKILETGIEAAEKRAIETVPAPSAAGSVELF